MSENRNSLASPAAEIISIGDELLIGQVVNTNASWMAQQLSLLGIPVVRISVISDDHEAIINALAEAGSRARVVLVTGGLGPTSDDITKQALCTYFNTRLVFDQESFNNIISLFTMRGFRISELNRKQAEIPEACTPVTNIAGTASGMWFEKDEIIYVAMPGVPFEMKPMMTGHVLPRLSDKFSTGAIVHKTVLTQGMGESMLAEKIEAWEKSLPANIKLAYLPQPGIVRLRLSASGADADPLKYQISTEIQKLQAILGDLIFGYDEDTLEDIVGKLLKEKQLNLCTAESCTGGYIAHRITSVPGSSAYYRGSIIAYANDIKQKFLNVSEKDLDSYGAVSEVVVRKMAENARILLSTDFAIATSGIAGPEGGTNEKPVGTTWIAVSGTGGTLAQKFLFGEHRERNIHKTAVTALNMLRKQLLSL